MQDTGIPVFLFRESPYQNEDESMEDNGEQLALHFCIQNRILFTAFK